MYKNINADGTKNLCGKQVAARRKALPKKLSQNGLAKLMQINGVDLDKNAIQRIESGERFVTDIELRGLAKVLNVSVADLIGVKE